MPGKSGSEVRRMQIVRTTRWDEHQFAKLQAIAAYSGCSEAEILRRLVMRADRQIIVSRELVLEIRRIGGNINQIARRLNAGFDVSQNNMADAYRDLLRALQTLKS